jgi:ribose transport system substrate-binding protein
MKKVITLVLAVAMILVAFSACTQAPAATSAAAPAPSSSGLGQQEGMQVSAAQQSAVVGVKENKVYNFAIIYGGVHPFFDPWRFGAQAAALDLKIPTPNVTSPQGWDQTQQNAIIDGLVAGGVNGIGMFTSDAVAGNEKIGALVDMGIPVVTMGGSPALPTKATFCYTSFVGDSIAYATQKAIDKMKADGKTSGNIVHLTSNLADTNTQKRIAAVKAVLSLPENAGFAANTEDKTFKTLADTDDTQKAEQAIANMYSSYVDDVDAIVCTGYLNAQAVAKKFNEDKGNHGIVAIGIDDSTDVMNAIKAGYMYGTMTQSSWAMGYVGTFGLKLLTDGYKYKEGAPFAINSGFWLCTKDNIADYDTRQQKIATDFVSTFADKFFDAPGAAAKPFDTASLPAANAIGFVGPVYEK